MTQPYIPPHDEAAEIAVLGGVMIDNDQWQHVSDLPAEAFYKLRNQTVWLAMHALKQGGQEIDLVTLQGWLAQQKGSYGGATALDDVGGMTYLIGLQEQTPYAYNTAQYGATVRDLWERRMLIDHSYASVRLALEGKQGERVSTAELQDYAAKIPTAQATVTSHVVTGAQADAGAVDYIRQLAAGNSPALKTGYPDLDREFCGFHPGSLTVLGARPSMGKSSLAIGIAERVAIQQQKHVQVLSLEMKASQIAVRQLCFAARVNLRTALAGEANEHDLGRLSRAAEGRAQKMLPNYLDQPDTTLQAVERLAKHLRNAGRLDFLVIDYLGLISVPGRDGDENDTQKLGIISRALKTLAIQLDIPILVLHQLNRELEKRGNKRPVMPDLRQSGRIEEDADNVLFVYRDEYYNPETADQGVAEVIVGKQRQGPRNVTARLQFHSESATFQSLAREQALI